MAMSSSRLILHTRPPTTPEAIFCFPYSLPLHHSLITPSRIRLTPLQISNHSHLTSRFLPTCNVISRSPSQPHQEYGDESLEKVKDGRDEEYGGVDGADEDEEIIERIKRVKKMVGSMEEGEISISAYDTAWVGLVRDENGCPQFTSALDWIANNQLHDGSWGDPTFFSAHDRVLNTLACLITLTSWNLHPHKIHHGMEFLKQNLCKLEEENAEHMPIGFEVAFPSLVDVARSLNIQVPLDSPFFKHLFDMRDLKLNKIPREVMYKVRTTLLHSLEGMRDLEWKELVKLQSQDGSFLFSPSSTAFALMHTKDQASLNYLLKLVNRFNGGVPNVYPVDMFEHIWAVDRLERLGISRYFEQEIKDCIAYVSRNWNEKGICWARYSEVQDIDDTAMGFRLLRLHGHQVSADVFENFEKNGEFFCFSGQSNQAVTGMFNLYRASQVMFPGEKILEDAKHFSSKYLTQKRAANQLLDKWIITKDLPGEVGYALDVPWYASLPRLEARFFIEHYGGENDVWIGKTLYRMPYVNNNVYLELAKLDYNNCQALHGTEWGEILGWYSESGLGEFGLSREKLQVAYFVSAASIFEPERSQERLAWAKTTALLHTITSFITHQDARSAFLQSFNYHINAPNNSNDAWWLKLNKFNTQEKLVQVLLGTLHSLASHKTMSHDRDIVPHLHQAWQKWMSSWEIQGNRYEKEAELVVEVINLSGGYELEKLKLNPQYQRLLQVTNTVCNQLRDYQTNKVHDTNWETKPEIESEMQHLVQLVLQNPPKGIQSNIKNTFLMVAKGFYYTAHFDMKTIQSHVAKVLFDKVM